MKFCKNCGESLADEIRFCSKCGSPAEIQGDMMQGDAIPTPPQGANIPTQPTPPQGANIPTQPTPPQGANIPTQPTPPQGANIPTQPTPPQGANIPTQPTPPQGIGTPQYQVHNVPQPNIGGGDFIGILKRYDKFIFAGLSALAVLAFLFPIVHVDNFGNVGGFGLLFGKTFKLGLFGMSIEVFKFQNFLAGLIFLAVPVIMLVISLTPIIKKNPDYIPESPKKNNMLILGIIGIVANILTQIFIGIGKMSIHVSEEYEDYLGSADYGSINDTLSGAFGMYLSYFVYIAVIVLAVILSNAEKKMQQ
jgi:hypothetical protein